VPTAQRLVHTIDAIDTTRLAAAFDTLSDALGATAPQVRKTLDGLSALSHTISSRDEAIRQLFAKAHSVTGVVASRDAEIVQLIVASNKVLDVLHRRKDEIHDLLVAPETCPTSSAAWCGTTSRSCGPRWRSSTR